MDQQAAVLEDDSPFVLLRAEGDNEDATLVVTFFGGQGGTVQANFDRWLSRWRDGRASPTRVKTSVLKTNDLTLLDHGPAGTFVADGPRIFNRQQAGLPPPRRRHRGADNFVRVRGLASWGEWDAAVQAFSSRACAS